MNIFLFNALPQELKMVVLTEFLPFKLRNGIFMRQIPEERRVLLQLVLAVSFFKTIYNKPFMNNMFFIY